jgi:fructose-bisphosphate aldolase class 1
VESTEESRRVFRSLLLTMPGINFLSGGQTPEVATANLNAMVITQPRWKKHKAVIHDN